MIKTILDKNIFSFNKKKSLFLFSTLSSLFLCFPAYSVGISLFNSSKTGKTVFVWDLGSGVRGKGNNGWGWDYSFSIIPDYNVLVGTINSNETSNQGFNFGLYGNYQFRLGRIFKNTTAYFRPALAYKHYVNYVSVSSVSSIAYSGGLFYGGDLSVLTGEKRNIYLFVDSGATTLFNGVTLPQANIGVSLRASDQISFGVCLGVESYPDFNSSSALIYKGNLSIGF